MNKLLNRIKTEIKAKKYNSFKSKEGYIFLTRSKNKSLFMALNKLGFFNFHKTNRKKQIVCLHQIILFLYKGIKSVAMGGKCQKGQLEIHHIDHNPSNNNIHNLEYTTPINNKAISTIVSICCNMKASYYNYSIQFDLDKVLMFGPSNFIPLLIKSIKASSSIFNKDLFIELLSILPYAQSKLILNQSLSLI
jgi:hypothetical protein